MKKYIYLVLVLIIFITKNNYAEIITLIDNSKVSGQIIHYYKDELEVNASGNIVNFQKDKIKLISFETPPSDPQYSTPEKTLKIWENAMKTGDWGKTVDCYALIYQNLIRQQLETLPAENKEKMKQDFVESEISIVNTKTEKDKVFLKINRNANQKNEVVELIFINENNEWKMIPAL